MRKEPTRAATPSPPTVKAGDTAPDFTANYLSAADANGRRQRKTVFMAQEALDPAHALAQCALLKEVN